MRVVVTGGAGFVGYHLVDEIIRSGFDVSVLDDMSRGSNVHSGARYIKGNAASVEDCVAAFRDSDIVFNLAATVAGVEYNMGHGYKMLTDNVILQSIPVSAAEAAGVPILLQVSSACVYHPSVNHPATEDEVGPDPHQANFGYGWAKRVGERVAMASDIDQVVVVRPSNIYGSRDYFDDRAHVIPSLIGQYASGQVRVIGDGSVAREFLHVSDAASGMLHVALNGADRQVYNLGTNGETKATISELHKAIADLVGEFPHMSRDPAPPNPERDRWSDCSKIHKTGWRHSVDLETGLKETVEWYLENR